MERFNKFINEQTGAELRAKLEDKIKDLKEKLKSEKDKNKIKDLEDKLKKAEADLEKLNDSTPSGGDNVKNPTKLDKEYEKSLQKE
jgi:predicted  nucleic acid-binding Zn-ribbon protein